MTDSVTRPDRLKDLTRWNRAGLDRFQYVDGDAATWLEELRIAMLGLSARGAEFTERLPETWRHRFSDDDLWPGPGDREAFAEALAWKTLARDYPDIPETARKRNTRLLEQYGMRSSEYGWEIMRAFARAAHVLLGHQDAYANEGYLRTATQWENIRRLAEMVNHQPAPPTSAITTVGLILNEAPADDEPIEIVRGLAMKHTPPEGGAPVVFETLEDIKCHSGLNKAQVEDWNVDKRPLGPDPAWWVVDDKASLSPGGLAIFAYGDFSSPDDKSLMAASLLDVRKEEAGTQITLSTSPEAAKRAHVELRTDPKTTLRGSPSSNDEALVVKIGSAANYPVNSVVQVTIGDGFTWRLAVLDNSDGHLKLQHRETDEEDGAEVVIETLTPVGVNEGRYIGPESFGKKAFYVADNATVQQFDGDDISIEIEGPDGVESVITEWLYEPDADAAGGVYVRTPGAKTETGVLVKNPVSPITGEEAEGHVIRFAGKPPKDIVIGDLVVMRSLDSGILTPLRIAGIGVGAGDFVLQFAQEATSDASTFEPDRHEFHGPMTRVARPVDHDRGHGAAFDGARARLTGLTKGAKSLLRAGKTCLIQDERTGEAPPVIATVRQVLDLEVTDGALKKTVDSGIDVYFDSSEGLGEFIAGWTTFNFNALMASHGETKSPKTLGSGDGERERQVFPFKARDVSFIPSTVAETGVAPDMDVSVDGVLWTYRDLIDPTAEGTESFSTSLTESGEVLTHFRRRLPTGTNNVTVRRYRTGVGAGGAVPARAFVKPMKKHRHVEAITQPFASSGGSEREPVGDIRINAPARLAANGRAVSLRDFERLCLRRSDIWQASARAVTSPARTEDVAITVVPAMGGTLSPDAVEELEEFIESRALPGLTVDVVRFSPVGLRIVSTIFVDTETYDKSLTQEAAQSALAAEFDLSVRRLGQTVYLAEVAAALERVEGVEYVTVSLIEAYAKPDTPPPPPGGSPILRSAKIGGAVVSLTPHPHQAIFVAPEDVAGDIAVTVEKLE